MEYRDMGIYGNPITGYNQEYYSAIIEMQKKKNNYTLCEKCNEEIRYLTREQNQKIRNYKTQHKNGS